MHVIVATDGSRQSLAAARHLKSFADPDKISDVSVVAVLSPYASVPFVDEISGAAARGGAVLTADAGSTFEQDARDAMAAVAGIFADWGPTVHQRLRSGSPAAEIVKAAKTLDAGLVVIASGSRGLSDTVLLGSTAQRVQHSAPCPVLVVRAPRRRRPRRKS